MEVKHNFLKLEAGYILTFFLRLLTAKIVSFIFNPYPAAPHAHENGTLIFPFLVLSFRNPPFFLPLHWVLLSENKIVISVGFYLDKNRVCGNEGHAYSTLEKTSTKTS